MSATATANAHLWEAIEMALGTIRAHKMRSLLTVLGVIIGTTTVIAVGSIIAGFDASVTESLLSFGANTIGISRRPQGPHFARLSREERMRKEFTIEDASAIKDLCPAVANATASIFPNTGFSTAKFRNESVVGMDFRGATPEFFSVYGNAALQAGRSFTETENQHRMDVAVAGHDLVRALYGSLDPVGQPLEVNGHTFLVLGVLERPSSGMMMGPGGEDRRVVIPYWTLRKLYPSAKEHFIRVEARTGQVNQAVDQIRSVLRQRRRVPLGKPDDFSLSTSDQALEQFHAITGMIALVMVILSSIGLLVGGIGVMNIMLVSVTERTREIGIRKALGARRRDIIMQFLLEAITLTASGGLLGIMVGALLSFLIRTFVPSLPSTVPLWSVLAGLLVSVSVGLFFGLWPAVKAARLDPVVALRYE